MLVHSIRGVVARSSALLAMVVAALGVFASSAAATTFEVTSSADPVTPGTCPSTSNCTLRQALLQSTDGDTIMVPAFHITLTAANGALIVSNSVTITGAGAGPTIVDGGGATRVFNVIGPAMSGYPEANASVTFKDLTVTGGSVTKNPANSDAGGAGIQFNSTGALHLDGVTVTGNTFTAQSVSSFAQPIGGGGIFSLSSVALTNSTISHNTLSITGAQGNSGGGGVMVTSGDLIVAGGSISDNTASIKEGASSSGGDGGGGAYLASGGNDLILDGTTIAGNTMSAPTGASSTAPNDGGGGIVSNGTSILVHDSTFSGNTADLTGDPGAAGGGAVLDLTGGGAYTNTTFASNTTQFAAVMADEGGGAIYSSGGGLSSLANDTFSGNSAGNGSGASLYNDARTVLSADTIFSSGSSSSANCAAVSGGAVISDGYNLYDDTGDSCGLTAAGDTHSSALGLGALGNNGGATQTVALTVGSPAVNAGNPTGCSDAFGRSLGTDERGVVRPQPTGGRCDVGAYELARPLSTTGVAGAVTSNGATLQGTASNPDVVAGTAYFRYGPTLSYGKTTPAQPVGAQSAANQHAAVKGLKPGMYHYQLVVTNPDGTSFGLDSTFVVSSSPRPAVLTGFAKKVGKHKVTLTGEFLDFGLAAKYQFQFGTSKKYGKTTKRKSAKGRTNVVTVSVVVHGLKPGRKYHYRLVVVSSSGKTNGSDQTFRTNR